jgi:hypothetical protein
MVPRRRPSGAGCPRGQSQVGFAVSVSASLRPRGPSSARAVGGPSPGVENEGPSPSHRISLSMTSNQNCHTAANRRPVPADFPSILRRHARHAAKDFSRLPKGHQWSYSA